MACNFMSYAVTPNEADTVGIIFVIGTYFFSHVSSARNLRPFKADQPEVIQSQIRDIERVFHFSNRFSGQKRLDR